MTAPLRRSARWLMNQPYLLLSLSSLFWAGNMVLGRFVADGFPPMMLSFLRWSIACLSTLPFAWRLVAAEAPTVRRRWKILTLLALTGLGGYNALAYSGLGYTQALNALLLQSAGPLFVALWSLLLLGLGLSRTQAIGIGLSLVGVLVILSRGNPAALAAIQFNRGDIILTIALAIFGLYSVLTVKRPAMNQIAFFTVTSGLGALLLIPAVIVELALGHWPAFTVTNALALLYVAVFPSTLAYLFFNRGVELIGSNRAAPFYHLVPVFGSAMAILLLGEEPRLFHAAGYVLVLAGVVIAARRAKPATAAAEAQR